MEVSIAKHPRRDRPEVRPRDVVGNKGLSHEHIRSYLARRESG